PSDSNISIHLRIVPSIDNPHRSFIFNLVDRELKAGTVIKIGRFTDRNTDADHISLKSKVVSRTHCELWVGSDGKLYLKDTKSSSGTFVNHVRLSSTHQASQPTEIHDGDIVQLGIDYQGGVEEVYRAVKMRFELNHQVQPVAFNTAAFNHIKSLACSPPLSSTSTTDSHEDVEECCICLYALAPTQALFVAPCSHTFHFKCIRPLLQSYPGFQCPLCRGYADLEASVATEAEEVATALQKITSVARVAQQQHPTTAAESPERRLSASHLMDKIKMAFSEKRKTPVVLRK
ncbi:SMAD/FHA domain-containing protein, partial [Dichotomocladium elegans]